MNYHRRYRTRVSVLILAVMVCALTGCPTSTELDRAAKASREIAFDVKTANILVGEFYQTGQISLAAKDKAADLLGQIGEKGNTLNEALIELDKKYPSGTIPPESVQFVKDNIAAIAALFRELFSGLDILGATSAVKELKKDVETLEKTGGKLK